MLEITDSVGNTSLCRQGPVNQEIVHPESVHPELVKPEYVQPELLPG